MHVQGPFTGQKVVFEDGECWIIGPDARFEDCEVVVKARSRYCIMNGAEFLACTITAKRRLQWDCTKARLTRCTLRGSFSGSDFGYRPPPYGDSDFGAIGDCDFSQAILDGCRFFGCDLSSLKLPPWPCFTIVDRAKAFEAIKEKPLPGTLDILFEPAVPGELACCYYAPQVTRERHVTEEEIHRLIQDNPYIR
jgi:hypothetical protein